jgi:hypothetical protein
VKILATLLLVVSLTGGCAAVHSVFTNPTGLITIDRQEFVNTYARVKVLYTRLRANFQGTPDELREIDRAANALSIQIEAKIAVPESEIDWAVVVKMLEALVSLVP